MPRNGRSKKRKKAVASGRPGLNRAALAMTTGDEGNGSAENGKKKKRNKKKKKQTSDQILASESIRRWFLSSDSPAETPPGNDESFMPPQAPAFRRRKKGQGRVLFELHSHSTCSDGFLRPSAVVERAHGKGVKVLALTDHDTMAGVPEAVEAAHKFGIRIIPAVEISTAFSPREGSGTEEHVHILAYYSSCGPTSYEELETCLTDIRNGRYLRAKSMLLKLDELKLPVKWEQVMKIAGNGVAPGRLHVARAMVEAGHVENLRQAFNKYLDDGGPAYAIGSEPPAEDVVQLILHTGGVAVLAHPWSLKNPVPVIKSLKAAGLHAMEVYRSDGKFPEFSDLADAYELLKLGGSDYHGRVGQKEYDLGSVCLPVLDVHEFLKLARPIWCNAIKDAVTSFAEEPSHTNLNRITRFGRMKNDLKEDAALIDAKDIVDLSLASWLTGEERQALEFEGLSLKLSNIVIS